ncbi:hypothetical protein [Rhodococcus marinonascens]|uniref:hypothetical protein n=1 Tax=Rhodococcus marinonascens TaxID=38311 RepID=UPI0014759135|nr:hypothetical protein [Rhodococcus marinonascens]
MTHDRVRSATLSSVCLHHRYLNGRTRRLRRARTITPQIEAAPTVPHSRERTGRQHLAAQNPYDQHACSEVLLPCSTADSPRVSIASPYAYAKP